MPAMVSAASPTHAAALEAFRPDRYGFRPYHDGWIKDVEGLGPVVVAGLGWQHAQAASYDRTDDGRVPMNALDLVVELQRRTWEMPSQDLVPANILAVLADTGGSALAAYDPRLGFNADGWLGFVFGAGSRSGVLVSHMLGVREEVRGRSDLGWHLKLIQGYEALTTGHTAAVWTFDPMRGANARLNIEKLGAEIDEFTIDKYGPLRSALYGDDVPSDRLTARWDLIAPPTAERLAAVFAGRYRGLGLDEVADLSKATPRSISALLAARPERLQYRIPGDIDRLMRDDPPAAIRWRREMRQVLSALLTTKTARIEETSADPAAVGVRERAGDYAITGFATGAAASGERVSSYVLTRKPGVTAGSAT